ncbi:hypothetical protein [Magnetospira sp. QH-2]|uniref:hypothetical protein n=1 Tax=Magnetospira sp. (strain QH-2) TaxID=1288970 RepID=UPI0003E80BB1|nr:hypothetical protein [Magnetospira sp. QH-2]CCQ74101.1 Conserved protein of unknown function [Magnetospira sp. QH-2]
MSSGWGCPHEYKGQCTKVHGHPCDPAMKGCVLFGKFKTANPEKAKPKGLKLKRANARPAPSDPKE